jgi:hypothetical protein
MACPTPYDADIERRHDFYSGINYKSRTPSPAPHSQQSSDSCKLRISRGTQPKATLEIRAQLVKFLNGGAGEAITSIPDSSLHPKLDKPRIEHIQCELFCKELYNEY